MFLYERIFGFGLYMLVLLFVCVLLTKTNASCKSTLRFYIICLCTMAFFYKPYITGDLYRIYEQMTFFSAMQFSYFWENYALTSSVPIARVLFWCISKTGVNALLPVFSSFVCFSLIFHIINKTQKMFSVSKKNVAYVLFFVMTTSIYISVIGGIRMMLALAMITFSFFRGTVEKKVSFIDILIYLVSVFIHTTSVIVIGICVLVTIFDSKKRFLRRLGFIFVVGIAGFVFARNFNSIINSVYLKFIDYVLGDRHSDMWEYIMGTLIVIQLLVLLVEFHRLHKEEGLKDLRSYNCAMLWCVIIAVVFCFEFSIFYRFAGHLAVIFSIPMMLVTLEKSNGRPSRVVRWMDFKGILMVISAAIAAISCTRGSLSSLKFFEL